MSTEGSEAIIPRSTDPSADEVARQRVILVIENDVLDRTRLGELLRASGHKVVEVSNTADAIWVISAGVAVDLVVSEDTMSSGPSGYMFATWLHVRRPDLPVIIVSEAANKRPDSTVGGRPLRFIPKPYTTEQLVEIVGEMMQGSRD